MSFKQTLPFSSLKSLLLLASSLVSFLILSTINFSHNFVVCNRYPFGLLVKFKLWNLTVLRYLSFLSDSAQIFVFATKLTRISLTIVFVPSPSGNTKLAYYRAPIVKRRFLGSWKGNLKQKQTNKQTRESKRNEKQTNKQKKKKICEVCDWLRNRAPPYEPIRFWIKTVVGLSRLLLGTVQ